MKIDNYRVISTGWKRKDRLHLRSATEVHWRGLQRTWAENWRLHAILSVLPTIPNIRLLSLYGANINEAQQAIIFGISTLRTLVVQLCWFHPSTKPLPLSRVNALKFVNTSVQIIRRLLTLVASTVESLDVTYYGDPIGSTLQDGLVELPKLSSITMKCRQQADGLAILDTFNQYKSITTIHILFDRSLPEVSFHHSDFPALRNVTCNHKLAVSLIPQRPVTAYVEIHSMRGGRGKLLNSLSETRAKITHLKIVVSDEFYSLLPSLATSLPHLEQLTLRGLHRDTRWFEPDVLSGQPSFNTPGAVDATLPKLKWVTYWVANYLLTDFPLEKVAETSLVPVCPALEVFECLSFTVCTPEFVSASLPEPTRAWKARRLPDGSWERQGPPPIPTPVPTKKLGAVS